LLPAGWLIGVLAFFPFRFVFEFNPDEGNELMLARLVSEGRVLYAEVYSDHPPVFTYLLSWVFKLTGPGVLAGRLVVLACSTLLIGCAAAYLWFSWGKLHAVLGVCFLALLPYFVPLSSSVMIGLPAIALALAAFVSFALWHQSRWPPWLAVSAATFALAVGTKLFAVWLMAGLIVAVVAEGILEQRPWKRDLAAIALWALLAGVLIMAIGLAVGPANLHLLFNPHARAHDVVTYVERARTQNIHSYLGASWPILSLAALGAIVVIVRRRWIDLALPAWLLSSYAFLAFTIPVWYHHQLIVTIPAALLAAIFGGEMAHRLVEVVEDRTSNFAGRLPALIGCGLVVAAIMIRAIPVLDRFRPNLPNLHAGDQLESVDSEVLALMWNYADATHVVITDRPIFAFRLGKDVPPDLALFSEKRLVVGDLHQGDIIADIHAYRPEQVLLTRFDLPDVEDELSAGYDLVYSFESYRLYVRSDLAELSSGGSRAVAELSRGP
jgi:hypothetical protein